MKKQVNVRLEEKQIEMLDAYAERMGITKSTLITFFVAQGLLGFDKAIEVSKEVIANETK